MSEESVNNASQGTKSDAQNKNVIGGRSAIVFSAAAGEPLPPIDLPDDFFELQKDEICSLYNQLKQSREDLENLRLRTKAVREMEESAALLSRLRHYTQTVVRVQFPDRLVLQAVFNHSDTVQTLIDFVRSQLDTDVQFQLYTAPPKCILCPELTLLESKLTPRALVYFSVDPSVDCTTFLKPMLTSHLTTPKQASDAALQYRREVVDEQVEPVSGASVETPSTSHQMSDETSLNKRTRSTSSKVPKWFKP